jgi:hypothetical protein
MTEKILKNNQAVVAGLSLILNSAMKFLVRDSILLS